MSSALLFDGLRSLRLRRPRVWIIAIALAGLAGCSATRLSYNQGSTLAWFWLDNQVDFNAAQKPLVKSALDDWFAWHRATQLPDVAELLADVRQQAADKVTATQLCRTADTLQQRALVWYLQALPSAVGVVAKATPAQIDELDKRLTKSREESSKEYLQNDPAERRKEQLKRTVERYETFYGKLDAAQRQQVAAALADSPFDVNRMMAERRQRQTEMIETLRRLVAERPDPATTMGTLRGLVEQSFNSPRADYRAYSQQVTQAGCVHVASLHNSTTPTQRRFLQTKLQEWEEDARVLAAQAVGSGGIGANAVTVSAPPQR